MHAGSMGMPRWRVGVRGRWRGRAGVTPAAATHQHGVAPSDDSAGLALLVVLTQQHVADVVGRGGGVGRGQLLLLQVSRHRLLHLGGRGQVGGAREGVHLVEGVHVEQW